MQAQERWEAGWLVRLVVQLEKQLSHLERTKGGYVDYICSYHWSRKLKNCCQTLLGTHLYPAYEMDLKGVISAQSWYCSKLHNKLPIALGSHTCFDNYTESLELREKAFSLHIVFRLFLNVTYRSEFLPTVSTLGEWYSGCIWVEAWRQCKVTSCLKVKNSPGPQTLVILDQSICLLGKLQ